MTSATNRREYGSDSEVGEVLRSFKLKYKQKYQSVENTLQVKVLHFMFYFSKCHDSESYVLYYWIIITDA